MTTMLLLRLASTVDPTATKSNPSFCTNTIGQMITCPPVFEASRCRVARQSDGESSRRLSKTPSSLAHVDQTVHYVAQYRGRQGKVKCSVTLHLERGLRGWSMTGTGYESGTTGRGISKFDIIEGIWSDSGRAYWVEEHEGGFSDDRAKVLVRGSFASADNFRGVRVHRDGDKDLMEEIRYDWFHREQPLCRCKLAKHIPLLLQELVNKKRSDEVCGVVFEQKSGIGPVLISSLTSNTVLGDSRLAVGMPVVLVNQVRVETPQHAAQVLREASGLATIVTFRDETVFDATLASRLVSTTLYKRHAFTKTGIVFRKRGDALFISSIKEGSMADEAGLQEFSRVWAINDQSHFESSQAAADFILNTTGYIFLVTDPTGSVDQPIDRLDDDARTNSILIDTLPQDPNDIQENSFYGSAQETFIQRIAPEDESLVTESHPLPFASDGETSLSTVYDFLDP